MKIKNSKIITGETIKENEKKKSGDCACENGDHDSAYKTCEDCACDAYSDGARATV